MPDLSENKGFTDFQNTEAAINTEAATRKEQWEQEL